MAMTEAKLVSAFAACGKILWDLGEWESVRNIHALPGTAEGFKHLSFVAEEGARLVLEGRREKAMRWLGFLQGALWNCRLATLDQLKNMNRPDEPIPETQGD